MILGFLLFFSFNFARKIIKISKLWGSFEFLDKDKFDNKMIDIESKSFEVNILMAGFVFEILESFTDMKSELYCELPYYDPNSGYKAIITESISLNVENSFSSKNVSAKFQSTDFRIEFFS